MQRTFCDRCGVDVTVKDAAPVRTLTIDTATPVQRLGDFTIASTTRLEICALCFAWLNAWLKAGKP